MSFSVTVEDYIIYLDKIAEKIRSGKDYITKLDAATGDGDHWVNLNKGFQAILSEKDTLITLDFSGMFRKIGMTLMNAVGGSSGVLYGSAYIGAAKVCTGMLVLDRECLCDVLDAMSTAIMKRGDSRPGHKTMIDAIHPAVQAYQEAIRCNSSDVDLLQAVRLAALKGAEATKNMEAVRGRACYQTNKGIGHLDPGAVTMSYQIELLTSYIQEKMQS